MNPIWFIVGVVGGAVIGLIERKLGTKWTAVLFIPYVVSLLVYAVYVGA